MIPTNPADPSHKRFDPILTSQNKYNIQWYNPNRDDPKKNQRNKRAFVHLGQDTLHKLAP